MKKKIITVNGRKIITVNGREVDATVSTEMLQREEEKQKMGQGEYLDWKYGQGAFDPKLGAIFYPTEDINGKPIPFDSLYLPYIWREIYFEGLYHDITNNRKDMVILDVGAQVGLTVKYLREHAKRVIAVEPSGENFRALKANKDYNKWQNVDLFNVALADKDGEMMLNTLDANRTCHSLINDYHQGGEKVKTMAFDTLFKEADIDTVDFCKFDCEGAEDMILRSEGFKKVADKIQAIEVEFHYPTWTSLVEYMIGLGYKAKRYDSSAIVVLFHR